MLAVSVLADSVPAETVSADSVPADAAQVDVTRAGRGVAGGRRRLKAAELADTLGTTSGFVAQVVAPLVKAGWVRSVPGPTGGYTLSADAAELSVLDIIEAVDGPTATGDCVVEDRPCRPDDGCPLHEAWSASRAVLLSTLGATSALAWREGAR